MVMFFAALFHRKGGIENIDFTSRKTDETNSK